MKKEHKIDTISISSEEIILGSKLMYKDPEIDISIQSKPLTDKDRKEISEFMAIEKKRLWEEGKITLPDRFIFNSVIINNL